MVYSLAIDGLAPKEWEVQDQEGRWFRMQIRPYRTTDNRLDGAVLSFVDVDALKHALKDTESARDYARSIVETVTSALVPSSRVRRQSNASLVGDQSKTRRSRCA